MGVWSRCRGIECNEEAYGQHVCMRKGVLCPLVHGRRKQRHPGGDLREEGLEVLLETSVAYSYSLQLVGFFIGAIGVILSTQKVHSKFCTPEILGAIGKWKDKWGENKLRQNFRGLKREEDPRVCDAVGRGVCTRELFPKCSKECMCDKRYYPTCWVQQKVFRCWTCDKGKIKFYCETCWKRDHQGHQCEEFFYPVRCGKEWNL